VVQVVNLLEVLQLPQKARVSVNNPPTGIIAILTAGIYEDLEKSRLEFRS